MTILTTPARPPLRRPGFLREVINTLVFVIAIYALAELAIPRSNIEGASMEPTFFTGEYVIISRIDYLFGDPTHGDIAIFQSPAASQESDRLIKRVIGIPGDTLEMRDAQMYRNGELLAEPYFVNGPCVNYCRNNQWILGEDEYFLAGDNRNRSNDSRNFGVVKRENIVGKAIIRYWPPSAWGLIRTTSE